jgi:small-conductance mechanosensitive channel
LVQSIVFLFVTHPYDVGDRVEIDGDLMLVSEFRLVHTVFERGDGRETYMPNAVLAQKQIINLRRSKPFGEGIEVIVPNNTPSAKIKELSQRMIAYIEQNEIKEMNPKCDISIKAFNDGELMTLNIYISHRTNNQEYGKKCARKNRFVWRLNDELRDLGIPVYPNALAAGLKRAI